MVLKWFSTKSEWFSSTYWIVTQLLHLLIWTRTKPNSERKQFLTCLDSYLDFSYALKKENQSHESGIEASTDTLCTSRCSSNRHKNVSFLQAFCETENLFHKKTRFFHRNNCSQWSLLHDFQASEKTQRPKQSVPSAPHTYTSDKSYLICVAIFLLQSPLLFKFISFSCIHVFETFHIVTSDYLVCLL